MRVLWGDLGSAGINLILLLKWQRPLQSARLPYCYPFCTLFNTFPSGTFQVHKGAKVARRFRKGGRGQSKKRKNCSRGVCEGWLFGQEEAAKVHQGCSKWGRGNWSLSKVAQKSLKSLSKVSQKSLKSPSKVPQKSLKSLSKVSQKSLKSLSKVPQKYLKSLSQVSQKSLKSLSKVSQK